MLYPGNKDCTHTFLLKKNFLGTNLYFKEGHALLYLVNAEQVKARAQIKYTTQKSEHYVLKI